MPDMNKVAILAMEGMIHSHSFATTVTKLWHFQRFEIFSEPKVVPELFSWELASIQPVGDSQEPDS